MKKYHSRDSFSVVEIAMILAVLGILLSLSFHGITRLLETSRKTKAIACLRTIAEAYRQYMDEQGHPIRWKDLDSVGDGTAGYDVTLIAAVLAKGGYLNAVDAWAWDFDYRVKKYVSGGHIIPPKICDIQRDGIGKVTSAKVNADFRGRRGFPTSVCAVVAANACANDDFLNNAGEIPIAYSRGLRDGDVAPGTWADSKINFDLGGIFGNSGGLIAFLDGHVEWFDNLGTGDRCALKKYGADAMTNKIYEAIPRGGVGPSETDSYVLSWKGGKQDCGYF
jgi:type II secretory pathway pseudopilin PulG